MANQSTSTTIRCVIAAAAAAAAFVVSGTRAAAQSVPVFNSSFEQPMAAPKGSIADPSAAAQGAGANDSAWIFTGTSGVARAGASIGPVVVPVPPDGNQVGYLAQGGSISQLLRFPADGEYNLTFDEAGAGIYNVSLDNVVILPSHITPPTFAPTSASFTATAGPHTLLFMDTDPRAIASPEPAFIDAVAVTPEPACGFVVAAAIAIASARRRRTQ